MAPHRGRLYDFEEDKDESNLSGLKMCSLLYDRVTGVISLLRCSNLQLMGSNSK